MKLFGSGQVNDKSHQPGSPEPTVDLSVLIRDSPEKES